MNLSDIRTLTRDLLDESGTTRFADADLLRWINRGYHRIVRYSELLEQTKYFTAVVGQRTYSLPTDYMSAGWVSLSFLDDDGEEVELDFLNFFQMRRYLSDNDNADPEWWSIFDGQLWVHPRFDQARTVYFRYKRKPTALSADTDSPEIDEALHEALAYWAAYIGCKKDKNHIEAAFHLADFKELTGLGEQIGLRQGDTRMIHEYEDLY